jgi:hypothetical protein
MNGFGGDFQNFFAQLVSVRGFVFELNEFVDNLIFFFMILFLLLT